MKHMSSQIESQIGKVLLQAGEIHEIPAECFSCCNRLVQHFSDTKSRDARYDALKCFTVAEAQAMNFLEVSRAI